MLQLMLPDGDPVSAQEAEYRAAIEPGVPREVTPTLNRTKAGTLELVFKE